jgi:hypothetical protein
VRSKYQRQRQLWRRLFHIGVALILVICILAPYVELAVEFNGSIFATGYDSETTIAVLVLLLELVISLAGVLVYLFLNFGFFGRIAAKDLHYVSFESALVPEGPALSAPPPLRI